MPSSLRTRLAAVIVAVGVLAACGGDDDTSDADRSDEPTQETTAGGSETTGDSGDSDADGADVTAPESADDDVSAAADVTTLTPDGLGPITIGMSSDAADATGMVEGTWELTCALSGQEERTTLLADPRIGQVTALDGTVATVLVIDDDVTTDPGGVGVGTSRDEADAAFAADGLDLVVDESTVETMGEFFWTAEADDGTVVFAGSIDPVAGEVSAIATPRIPICE